MIQFFTSIFLKWAIPGLFFFIFVFSKQQTVVNIFFYRCWIRTALPTEPKLLTYSNFFCRFLGPKCVCKGPNWHQIFGHQYWGLRSFYNIGPSSSLSQKFKTFHNLVTLNLLSTRFNEVCHMLATHYQNSDLFLGILMSRKSL